MIKKAFCLVLTLLVAGPVEAAQTLTRVHRSPVPIRTGGFQVGPLNLKLNSPLTSVNGLPLLTPNLAAKPGVTIINPAEISVPQAMRAEAGEPLTENAVAPMAQLNEAVTLAEFGRSDNGASPEQSGQAWNAYWTGSKSEDGTAVEAGSPAGTRKFLSKSSKRKDGGKTMLFGGAAVGGLEIVRQGLESAGPLLSAAGAMTGGLLLSKLLDPALENIGKRHGWQPETVAALQKTYKVLLVAAGLMFAIGAPAAAPAVWAVAGPLASGLGVLSLTKLADGALNRRLGGEKGALPFGLRAALWTLGGGLAAASASTGLGLGLELVRQGLDAASPYLGYVGLGYAASQLEKPLTRLFSSWGARRGWQPGTVKALQGSTRVLLVAGLLLSPMLLPAAVWAAAAPYAAGAAVIGVTRLVDSFIGKKVGDKPAGLGLRAVLWALGGAIAMEATGFPVDLLLGSAWSWASPYTGTVGALAAAYGVSRLARWGIDQLAARGNWQPNTKVVARLIASIVVWTGGVAFGLSAAGVSTAALMTTFGVGGIAVTMAARDFIGNFMEAAKILMTKPYVVGDKVKIDDKDYLVKGMSLRYLELEREPGKLTLITYAQISGKAITIQRAYTSKHKRFFAGGVKPVTFSDLWRSAGFGRAEPKIHMGKAALLAGIGLAGVLGLPVLAAASATSLPWLAGALPYLKAFAALWMTRWTSQWITGLVSKLGAVAGWDPQSSTMVKFLAQALTWTLGGTVALYMAGVTWAALLTAVGASSIALGWASADVIGNLIQGMWILATQPFKIEDTVEIGKSKGKIVDMSVNFVVLENEGGSHTLVPYAVVKASEFTVAAPQEDVK